VRSLREQKRLWDFLRRLGVGEFVRAALMCFRAFWALFVVGSVGRQGREMGCWEGIVRDIVSKDWSVVLDQAV
jgi:hypothetical protein